MLKSKLRKGWKPTLENIAHLRHYSTTYARIKGPGPDYYELKRRIETRMAAKLAMDNIKLAHSGRDMQIRKELMEEFMRAHTIFSKEFRKVTTGVIGNEVFERKAAAAMRAVNLKEEQLLGARAKSFHDMYAQFYGLLAFGRATKPPRHHLN